MTQEHFRHHVALGSGKDETGIMAVLDVGAQYGFHIRFSIAADGLEFINSHDARLISTLQIMENFIERCGWTGDFSQIYSPRRHAVHIEADG